MYTYNGGGAKPTYVTVELSENLWRLQSNHQSECLTGTLPVSASLAGGKVFSRLDLSHAYQQLELDAESQHYVTVNTHKGIHRYLRMPYGVSSAPSIFQSFMDQIPQGMDRVICFLDDILITAEWEQEHLNVLDEILTFMEQCEFRVNLAKCSFAHKSVKYLGHRLDASRGLLEGVVCLSWSSGGGCLSLVVFWRRLFVSRGLLEEVVCLSWSSGRGCLSLVSSGEGCLSLVVFWRRLLVSRGLPEEVVCLSWSSGGGCLPLVVFWRRLFVSRGLLEEVVCLSCLLEEVVCLSWSSGGGCLSFVVFRRRLFVSRGLLEEVVFLSCLPEEAVCLSWSSG